MLKWHSAAEAKGGLFKVRVVYSDETGIGDSIRKEPITLVAAIMLNMDSQWSPIKNDVECALSSLMTPERAARYELKGKKLFSGIRKGYGTPFKILSASLNILARHKVPIFYGAVSRIAYQQLTKRINASSSKKRTTPHVRYLSGETQNLAFFTCASDVDSYVHTGFPAEQVLWVAAKSRADARLQAGLADLRVIKAADLQNMPGGHLEEPHIIHIADSIYYGDMCESRALQLADLCCSVIVRTLKGDRWAQIFYKLIKSNVVSPKPPSFASLAMSRRAIKALYRDDSL